MNQVSIDLPTDAASLKSLESKLPNEASILILQAPSGNGAIAYFGSPAVQVGELAAGAPFYAVPADVEAGRINLNELYVKGTSPDKLTVMWMDVTRRNL
jgi:hypothetical protein